MQLTDKQLEGIAVVMKRYEQNQRYAVISGYAGTGKSTLVKYLIAAMQQKFKINPSKDVCYSAFTGKATQVLKEKGNKPTQTLHRLLWTFFPRDNGKFVRKANFPLDYKIVVVDECSMVDTDLLNEIIKHKETFFIFCGDPGQLPPVSHSKDDNIQDGYSLLQTPHIFLDEIMRQALNSEIIKLSMEVRQGKPLQRYIGTEIQVLDKNELTDGMLLWADQVICATNATRNFLNQKIRELKGFSGEMQEGDKIICLRNQWDIFSNNGDCLVNGTIGIISNVFNSELQTIAYPPRTVETYRGYLKTDGEDMFENLCIDKQAMETGEYSLNYREVAALRKKYQDTSGLIPVEMTYGYAVTCWKAQGSEWDKVLIIEEGFPFKQDEHQKFLYTAITRGAKKVVIIRK